MLGKKTEDVKKLKNEEPDTLEMIDMEDVGRKKKKKRKMTVFDYIRYGIMLVAAIVFVVAGYNLYTIFSEYARGEAVYDQVAKDFTDEEVDTEVEVSGDVVYPEGFVRSNVDFESLQAQNPDVKGWIQFEGISDINYPVLQHPEDNNFYLKKMWNKEENTAGSIFLDVSNGSAMEDYNTFIYGHNMKNLSMFGHLKEYKDQANFAGKEFFWIYTPTANYRYQIFSIHESKVDSSMFKTYQTGGEEYANYVQEAKAQSLYDTGLEVSGEDRIVTLSTCTSRGNNWRLLIQAKMIGVEYKPAGNMAAPEEAPAEQQPGDPAEQAPQEETISQEQTLTE